MNRLAELATTAAACGLAPLPADFWERTAEERAEVGRDVYRRLAADPRAARFRRRYGLLWAACGRDTAAPWPDPPAGLPRVGFVGAAYLPHGGTETWHQLLLPPLAARGRLGVVGYAVPLGGGDPRRLGVPYQIGLPAMRGLARSVDVLVAWGLPDLADYLPPPGDPQRPRVVLVLHSTEDMPWHQQVLAGAAPHVDRIVAVSACAVPRAPQPAPIAIIPNGVDPARSRTVQAGRPATRAALGLEGQIAVLALARLSEEKRLPLAAAAVERLGWPYTLLVAGEGPCKTELEGRPAVRLLGRRDDVADLLAAADVLVSPSAYEGFGLSIVEAMLAGVPVIGTPTGVLAERPELARIVPLEAGPESWAAALAADRADPEGQRARIHAARAAAEADYAVDRFVRDWETYLLDLSRM